VSLLLAATPLAGAAVVCAAVYYGLRLTAVAVATESAQDSTCCVLLPPPEAADIRTWERNLYDWAALRDPTLLVLPNERFGFSRERFAKLEIPSAAVPPYHFSLRPVRPEPLPPVVLCGRVASLPERVASAGEPIQPPPVEPVLVEPLPQMTFWRLPDGRMVSGLPAFDERQVREAVAVGPAPKSPTTLRVSRVERLATARIVVTGSSANPALDGLALSVLRRAVGVQEMLERLPGKTLPRPDYLPPFGQDLEVQVEWATSPPAAVAPGG